MFLKALNVLISYRWQENWKQLFLKYHLLMMEV